MLLVLLPKYYVIGYLEEDKKVTKLPTTNEGYTKELDCLRCTKSNYEVAIVCILR